MVKEEKRSKIYDEMKVFVQDNYHEYINMLIRFCDGQSFFHREFGHPQRRICDSVYRLQKQIMYYNFELGNNVYVSAYDFGRFISADEAKEKYGKVYNRKVVGDYQNANINKVYFDLDYDHKEGGVLEDAWNDAMVLRNAHKHVRIIYTANRGFNVYVPVNPYMSYDDLLKAQVRTIFHDDERVHMKLHTADVGFLGDISRIMRLPFSIHPKTNRVTVPVIRMDTLDSVIERSERVPTAQELRLLR